MVLVSPSWHTEGPTNAVRNELIVVNISGIELGPSCDHKMVGIVMNYLFIFSIFFIVEMDGDNVLCAGLEHNPIDIYNVTGSA